MATQARRTFTVRDAMILTAAAAAGFALLRATGQDFEFTPTARRVWYLTSVRDLVVLSRFATVPLAPALLAARLLPPRPAWRRVWRQPGAVACFAVTLAAAAQASPFYVLGAATAPGLGAGAFEDAIDRLGGEGNSFGDQAAF